MCVLVLYQVRIIHAFRYPAVSGIVETLELSLGLVQAYNSALDSKALVLRATASEVFFNPLGLQGPF